MLLLTRVFQDHEIIFVSPLQLVRMWIHPLAHVGKCCVHSLASEAQVLARPDGPCGYLSKSVRSVPIDGVGSVRPYASFPRETFVSFRWIAPTSTRALSRASMARIP